MERTVNPAMLMSLHPRFAHAILSGQKTQELRRRFPLDAAGTTVYAYSTSPEKQLLGRFTISRVEKIPTWRLARTRRTATNLTAAEVRTYLAGLSHGVVVSVSDPAWFLNPVGLSDLRTLGLEPPQSYRFIPSNSLAELQSRAQLEVAVPQLDLPDGWKVDYFATDPSQVLQSDQQLQLVG